MSQPKLTGACLCGAVRYSVSSGPLPLSTSICNCKDCQRSSGSAFAVVVPVRTSAVTFEGEPLSTYTNTGSGGETRDRKFCGACGSQILSVIAEVPEITWLKAGTLDDTSSVQPAAEVWGTSAQAWTRRTRPRARLPKGPPAVALKGLSPVLRKLGG